jgi:glycosyltransferase involved in cell wall biosynthesis
MACGLPVIAGNLDGSVDALNNGELGTLVNPNNLQEIVAAIQNYKNHPLSNQPELLKTKIQEQFGYDNYREKLKNLLLH